MSAPVRVTTMVDSLLAGGAERVAVEVACALDRSRFEPHVLVTRGDGPLRRLLDDAGVPVTLLDRSSSRDLAPWRRARRHLASECDVLHAHKFGSNVWGSMLARAARVPLVAHEHNFSEQPDRARRILDRHLVARTASRILCVSDSVADVERACGVPDRLLEVVPNGVSLDAPLPRAQARAELGLSSTSFVVGIVGRLRPEKAHEVLIEAAAQVACSGGQMQLCIVGDGPRRTELELLAARLGFAGRIHWAGERRDAARLAAAFDVGVICSHWEGLPLAALETMAAGVPLIATRVGGLPTLLDGGAGVLVDPADPAAIAAQLVEWQRSPQLASEVGAAGRERILKQYTIEGMVRRIEGIYLDVLRTGRPARRRTRSLIADPHQPQQQQEAA